MVLYQSISFSADGQRLVAADHRAVRVWELTTGKPTLNLGGHSGWVMGVTFSADGKRLTSVGQDGSVNIWDTGNAQKTLTLKLHTGSISGVAFSSDGTRLAGVVPSERKVKVWNASTGKDVVTMRCESPGINLKFSPDGKWLASPSRGTVMMWNAETGQGVLTFRGHVSTVNCIAFSPDGKRLASAGVDRMVKVWDRVTGQEVYSLAGGEGALNSLAFSPDGKRLASAGDDGIVNFWNAGTENDALRLEGHAGAVYRVAFSPDGKQVASAGQDGTVRVWDSQTGQERLNLSHANPISDVAFNNKTMRLLTADTVFRAPLPNQPDVDHAYARLRAWDAKTGVVSVDFALPVAVNSAGAGFQSGRLAPYYARPRSRDQGLGALDATPNGHARGPCC